MEFGKIKNIEQDWCEIKFTTKGGNKVTVSTDDSASCCENFGIKIMSGLKYLKESKNNTLFYESDIEDDNEGDDESEKEDDSHYDRYGSEPSIKYIVIKTSDDKKCIIKCYNSHNGYYPHTFKIAKDDETIHTFML